MKNKDFMAIAAALGAAFFWSFSFVWFKIAFLAYKPITVVIFRLAISAVLITVIAWALKRLQKPTRKDFRLFILMALFEPFIYFLGESYGLQYVSSTVAAVIVATIPLLTPIAAWYFHKEKVNRMNLFGLLFSFVGVALVVLNGSFKFDASPLGVGLEFMAVFAAIAYAIVLKSLAERYNTLTIIAYQNIIGMVLFLPIWFVLDFTDFIHTPFHAEAFRAIILLAVFSSTLAFVFFTQSVRHMGVTKTNTFINLIPVFVAILAFIILKDELGVQKIAGILVVVTGLFLSQLKKRKDKGKDVAVEVHRR
ncbi:DMT family transporter [uncultured Draconibacterium sp.]|uniref:DMT family transporter n=1 Tax=uncultured Draconibacterium sp. TaxID=1573823 RepID=UPI0032169F5E